jgi:ssDNA-binding replication factor A large subunit
MEKIQSIFIEGTYEVFDGIGEGSVKIQTESGKDLEFSISDLKNIIEVYRGGQGRLSYFKNKAEYNPYKINLFSTPDKRVMDLSLIDENPA